MKTMATRMPRKGSSFFLSFYASLPRCCNAVPTYDWKYFVHSSHTSINFVEVFSEDNRAMSISWGSRIGVEGVLFSINLTQSVHIEVWRCPLKRTAKTLTF